MAVMNVLPLRLRFIGDWPVPRRAVADGAELGATNYVIEIDATSAPS